MAAKTALGWSSPVMGQPASGLVSSEVCLSSDSSGTGTGLSVADDVRTIPHNLEAEQALLGSLLHNNSGYEYVAEFLLPEHFADPVHGKIFRAIGLLIERGQIADPITLRDYFQQDQQLAEIGGTDYLAYLATTVISIINPRDYARLIHDLALRRELIQLGSEMVNNAHTPSLESSAHEQIEHAEQRLYDLATSGQIDRGFVQFVDALSDAIATAEKAYKRESRIVGVTTGLHDMDRWLGGLHPSDLIILAGRPSMGKTALATNIAFNAAVAALDKREGAVVAFFSLEMSAEQLAGRLLAQEAEVASDKIRRGELTDQDFPKFVEVSRRLARIPLFIDDTPALSVSALRTRARRLKRKHGLGLIVIDYLQLIGSSSHNRLPENRVQEVSEVTRGLKALAKELNVPVIALSQLSRAVEGREDKRPQLADLRESGSIEQDADVVMFIFREEYYLARQEPSETSDKYEDWQAKMAKVQNLAEVIIAKQRHGPIGTIKLFYNAPFTKFTDLLKDDHLTSIAFR
jgi:replicative DNA helicase